MDTDYLFNERSLVMVMILVDLAQCASSLHKMSPEPFARPWNGKSVFRATWRFLLGIIYVRWVSCQAANLIQHGST
jgi:hypothetical protein